MSKKRKNTFGGNRNRLPLLRRASPEKSPSGASGGPNKKVTAFLEDSAYKGASWRDRKTRRWLPMFSRNPDEEILPERLTLLSRCRDEYRNNPIARSAVTTPTLSVIGSGLQMQCRIDRSVLGLSEDECSAWESKTERLFSSWAEHTDADTARRESFYGLQQLAFRSYRLSGEVFALLPLVPRPGTICDLRVQLIEADRISTPENMSDAGVLHSGIETGNYGEPVAYHIETTPMQPYTAQVRTWSRVPAFGSSGRQNVIHIYQQDRPNQRRGISSLAPILISLKKLGQFTDAELTAAVVSSLFTGFITSENEALMDDLTNGVVQGGESAEKNKEEEGKPPSLEAGAMVALRQGEKVEFANPTRPNTAFDGFVGSVLRQVGMALNIPYEVLIQHFSSSYSASRASIMQAWSYFMTERSMFVSKFCQSVYEEWLWEMILTGQINAPGFIESVEIRRAYSTAKWHGPIALQIDPVKEAAAAERRLGIGLTNIAEETANLTGGNYEDNYYQRSKEIALAHKVGVPDGVLIGTSTTIVENNGNEEKNEDE
jgi:lambda family phage portal protein